MSWLLWSGVIVQGIIHGDLLRAVSNMVYNEAAIMLIYGNEVRVAEPCKIYVLSNTPTITFIVNHQQRSIVQPQSYSWSTIAIAIIIKLNLHTNMW